MKSNVSLQASINFFNSAQKVWYAAHVLKAALVTTPSIVVRKAVPAIPAQAAILAQAAHPAYPARAAVLASANTVGYAINELYKNSPAYPIGTAIPAIPAKSATLAVAAVAAVVAVPAITAISSPAITAIKGWEDAITITQVSASRSTVVIDLPYFAAELIGSTAFSLGEITPKSLQANAWLDTLANQAPVQGTLPSGVDIATETLEGFLWRNAMDCSHTISNTLVDVAGVPTKVKRLTVDIYHAPYLSSNPGIHLDIMQPTAYVNPGS